MMGGKSTVHSEEWPAEAGHSEYSAPAKSSYITLKGEGDTLP